MKMQKSPKIVNVRTYFFQKWGLHKNNLKEYFEIIVAASVLRRLYRRNIVLLVPSEYHASSHPPVVAYKIGYETKTKKNPIILITGEKGGSHLSREYLNGVKNNSIINLGNTTTKHLALFLLYTETKNHSCHRFLSRLANFRKKDWQNI
jgi:hypothetical protein